jgi:hypothetical protein
VTEQEPRDSAAPVTHRRRRAAALTVQTWLAAARHPTRRGALVAGGVIAVIFVVVLVLIGLLAWNRSDNPPTAQPSASVAPSPSDAATPSPGPPESAKPTDKPTGKPTGKPAKPPGGRDTTPTPTPGDQGTPSDAGRAPRPDPRLVGPKDLDGFITLLSDFCQARGDRTAVLLDGPDENPKAGDWVCVKVVTFTPINLDEVCRKSFGDASQARRSDRYDSRTWRCFDS